MCQRCVPACQRELIGLHIKTKTKPKPRVCVSVHTWQCVARGCELRFSRSCYRCDAVSVGQLRKVFLFQNHDCGFPNFNRSPPVQNHPDRKTRHVTDRKNEMKLRHRTAFGHRVGPPGRLTTVGAILARDIFFSVAKNLHALHPTRNPMV